MVGLVVSNTKLNTADAMLSFFASSDVAAVGTFTTTPMRLSPG